MENKAIEDELTSIRELMERSSKFISLSGLSGIMAGIYALVGAAIAYHEVYGYFGLHSSSDYAVHPNTGFTLITHLFIVAVAVLMAAVATGVLLSVKKARRMGQSVWGKTAQSLLFYAAIPLVTGGLFMLILMNRGYYMIVAPASLIFYGMALICGSHYTFTDVKYLGLLEIILGLTSAMLPGYGLLFWALGFGVLHIVYGSIMYFKYDR